MVWKIGPACVAQHAKNVAASTMNGRDRKACIAPAGSPPDAPGAGAAIAGGADRMHSAAGSNSPSAPPPTPNCPVRQSWGAPSPAANGEIVIGATPTPADTSETARLRCLSNHPAVDAI